MHKAHRILLSLTLSSTPVFAGANHYLGVDVQQREIRMAPGYGSGMFDKRLPQLGLHLGHHFSQYFDAEIGVTTSQSTTRTAIMVGPGLVAGYFVPTNELLLTRNHVQINTAPISLLTKLPIEWKNASVFLRVGASVTKIRARLEYLGDQDGLFADGTKLRTFQSTRVIPQAGVGLQIPLTTAVHLRFQSLWTNTNKFRYMVNKEKATPTISFKNQWTQTVGLDLQF